MGGKDKSGSLLRSTLFQHTLSMEILRAAGPYKSKNRRKKIKACHPQKNVCIRARSAGSFSDTLSWENLITTFKMIHLIVLSPLFPFK